MKNLSSLSHDHQIIPQFVDVFDEVTNFLKCLNALHRDSLCTPTITGEDFT